MNSVADGRKRDEREGEVEAASAKRHHAPQSLLDVNEQQHR
jgi:hypothetical protein